jgi:hypothetical protein
MSKYSDDFINKIIYSLINGNVIKMNNNNITLNTQLFIKNFGPINMIDIFHTFTNFKEFISNIIQVELAHDRNDII